MSLLEIRFTITCNECESTNCAVKSKSRSNSLIDYIILTIYVECNDCGNEVILFEEELA